MSPAREAQEPSHRGPVTEVAGRPPCPLLQEEFPVREDLSDDTDEGACGAEPPPPPQPAVASFRLKNDSDLFGLGLEETGPKISDEGSLGAGGLGRHLPECPPRRHLVAGKLGLLRRPLEHPWLGVARALPSILGPLSPAQPRPAVSPGTRPGSSLPPEGRGRG